MMSLRKVMPADFRLCAVLFRKRLPLVFFLGSLLLLSPTGILSDVPSGEIPSGENVHRCGAIADPALTELSGLAPSRLRDDVL